MITRRYALHVLGSASAAAFFTAAHKGPTSLLAALSEVPPAGEDPTLPLAPGTPNSPERLALVSAFKEKSEDLQKKFEARSHKSDWVMPYRLFRPTASGKLPLILYLHGSGGLGDDNEKQLGLGNVFGTRVWLLPDNQQNFPCYVFVPQTDRGWAKYDFPQQSSSEPPKVLPGMGDGSRLALEIIDKLLHEFEIDDRRIYVTGQSMGGAGTWNIIASRPSFFAAAVPLCGSETTEDGTGSIKTPLWNFHGASDKTVPVALSRNRIAARRKAGGHPLYTEYPGVDHNVWEWAFTEPQLVKWVFAQRRA
jgi:predicted peptidase